MGAARDKQRAPHSLLLKTPQSYGSYAGLFFGFWGFFGGGLAPLGPHLCTGIFSSRGKLGLPLPAVQGRLIAAAPLAVGQQLRALELQ